MPGAETPSDEAKAARVEAAEARRDAELNFRKQTTTKFDEMMMVIERLRDHSRADTFTAMIQHELTRRGRASGL
jgi:hypothetical protein